MFSILEAALERLENPVSLCVDPNFVKDVEKSISLAIDRNGSLDYDTNPRGINFQDGQLMIGKDSMVFDEGHDKSRVFTYCLPFKYKGDRQESKVWGQFINQIIPNKQKRRYVLASMANAISGDPMYAQRMLVLMGVAASGKSTFIEAVVNTIGSHNTCRVDDLRNLTKDESRYRIDLAGNILCICGDASGNIGNKDVLKQIISKEEISGRRLYKEVEFFVPRASLIIATNEIGFTHALGDSGISRRLDIVKFDNPVSEQDRDPFISKKLSAPIEQREMILDMIDSLIDMQQTYGKMVRPDELAKMLDNFRVDGDSFLSFMYQSGFDKPESSVEDSEHEYIDQGMLRDAYNRWALKNGVGSPGTGKLKGKMVMNGFKQEPCHSRMHKYLVKITDREVFVKTFYINGS
jgi:phage/plasmid-associated DNA primase